jgi:adenosylcobinamide hydrolase
LITHDGSPEIRLRHEDGHALATRLWRLGEPMLAVSSAPFGGGLGLRHWVLNAQVPTDYDCDEPRAHLGRLAAEAGLEGAGTAMMTAVDVRTASTVMQEGIYVDATVGVNAPQWAAAAPALDDQQPDRFRRPAVGTINIVMAVPERLSDAALVNAIGTATEAKAQALWEAGLAGTGTVTDALCLLCPAHGEAHAYGGPRSAWGSRLARAVHRAVLAGCPADGSA